MKKKELKNSIVGVVISQMEQYDGTTITTECVDNLYKSIKKSMEKMKDTWWGAHFPLFYYSVTVQTMSAREPGVVINWTPDTRDNHDWDRLYFVFNPSRLAGSHDPFTAYKRAMSVI